MKRNVWMEVTRDQYELPVRVANSAKELASLAGTTLSNVMSGACRGKKGLYKSRFVKVEVDMEEEEIRLCL